MNFPPNEMVDILFTEINELSIMAELTITKPFNSYHAGLHKHWAHGGTQYLIIPLLKELRGSHMICLI